MSRKLIAIFTALLLAASLCACGDKGGKGEETTEDNRIEIPTGEDTTAEDTTKDDEGQTTESQTQTPTDNFEECNDTVYILVPTKAANLRTAPSLNASTVALSLENGTELQRIGVNNDGWSKVIYNDQEYFIKTSCIVSETELSGFVAASGTITVTGNFNIRIAPNTANDPVGNFAEGDSFEVIAVNETTGWYKIYLETETYTGEAYVAILPEYMEGEVVVETETTGNEDTTAEEILTETPGEE